MTPGRLVALRGPARTLPERVREVRAAGDVPLIGDDRAPDAVWQQVRVASPPLAPHPDAAWATLTSGTSGSPRIVQRTAASWADSFPAVADALEAVGGADEAVALPAPPSSSLTLFSLAHALAGGPRPILPRAHVLTAVDAAEATCFHGTPHALRALLDAGAPPRLRAALVGGSHLDPALRARAEAAGVRVSAYYGAAELSYVALDTGDGLRAFPGVELAVRGGVLWVRSPYAALGYLGRLDAAATADTADTTDTTASDADGPFRRDGDWATVGDRAELVDGRLRLLGRADDAILSASATVVPEEVEAVLRTIPGVHDAVVFALERERVGALVAAMIELRPGVDRAPDRLREATAIGEGTAIREAAAGLLAPAHRPRRWFTGELPRTSAGKPARAEVVRRVAAGEVERLD